MSASKLVSMANQIGKFFVTQPGADAAADVADHLKKFWDPSMIRAIVEHLRSGGEGMQPEVRLAVERLAMGHATAPASPPDGRNAMDAGKNRKPRGSTANAKKAKIAT